MEATSKAGIFAGVGEAWAKTCGAKSVAVRRSAVKAAW
jgi:hypothetical protein